MVERRSEILLEKAKKGCRDHGRTTGDKLVKK